MSISDQAAEITVELVRPGSADSVLLDLPQGWAGLRDALERIHCTHPQSIFTTTYEARKNGRMELSLKEPAGLYQLNRLASRLSQLNEADAVKFDGLSLLAMKRKSVSELSVEEYIDLTYNLDNVHLVEAASPDALGRFLYDNDLVPELSARGADIALKYIDFERIGRERIEQGEAVFVSGRCVIFEDEIQRLSNPADYLYVPEKPGYTIKLECVRKDRPGAEPVVLTLPAGKEEISPEGRKLVISRAADFTLMITDAVIPQLIGWQEDGNCLAECMKLASKIERMSPRESLTFKAGLEATYCTTVCDAGILSYSLGEFQLDQDIRDCESYGEYYLEEYLPPGHAEALIRHNFPIYRLGQVALDLTNTVLTAYGTIHNSDGSPLLDFTLDRDLQEPEPNGIGQSINS